MKRYSLVKEHPSHFEIDDGSGVTFKVAKPDLHHSTVERIRAHFADGGEVKKPDDFDALAEASRAANANMDKSDDAAEWLQRTGKPYAPPKADAPVDADFADRFGAPPPSAPDPRVALSEAPQAPVGEPPPLLQRPVPEAPSAPLSAGMPRAAPPANAPPDIAKGLAEEREGITAKTAAESSGNRIAADIQGDLAKRLADSAAQSEAAYKTRLADIEKQYNDVASGKVDSDRWWHSKSTAGQIGASIGLILGGLGAGLTRGPNFALETINKAIDRDMEAQKLDLHNKNNALAAKLRITQDLNAAEHLARADKITAAAAQLQSVMSGTASQTAIANGQIAHGALLAKAAQEVQLGTQREAQIRHERIMAPVTEASARLGLQQQQMGVEMQGAQLGAMKQLLGGQAGGGQTMDPRAIALLPKEYQEKIVSLPDGTYALARSPKDAEEVAKTHQAAQGMRDKLARYSALIESHPRGISETLSPSDYAAAKSLHSSIITDINGLAGLNRLNEREVELFSERVPDISKFRVITGGARAKMKELGNDIDSKVWNYNQQFLNMPRQRRPGG